MRTSANGKKKGPEGPVCWEGAELAEDLGGEFLGGFLCLVALKLDQVLDWLTKDGGELDVSGVEATVGVLANLNCFLSGGAEDSGHVVVCLFCAFLMV